MIVSVLAASSTKVLDPANREKIILSNRGDETIWLIFATDAVVEEGFPLDPGEKVILEKNNSNKINAQLNAIAENADTDLSVYAL